MGLILKTLKKTGALKNAPVKYVICKIDCGDLLSFDNFLKESQELFRKNGFPIFHHQIVKDVHIQTSHGISIEEKEVHTYHFISGDYNNGIVVSGGNIFIQTKNYINFNLFSEIVKKAHKIYSSVTDMKLIRAIGLRYIDLIEPKGRNNLDFYLNSSVLSPNLNISSVKPVEARMQHTFKTDLDSILFLRVFAGKNHKMVPDDLVPMVEPLFIKAGNKENLPESECISALVDTDHYKEFPSIIDADSINVIQLLDKMHTYTSHLFCSVVTEGGMEEWK